MKCSQPWMKNMQKYVKKSMKMSKNDKICYITKEFLSNGMLPH